MIVRSMDYHSDMDSKFRSKKITHQLATISKPNRQMIMAMLIDSTSNCDHTCLGSEWFAFKEKKIIQEGSQCDFQLVDKANMIINLLVHAQMKIKNK